MGDVSASCDAGEKLSWTKDDTLRAGTIGNEARQQLECTYSISCSMLIERDCLVQQVLRDDSEWVAKMRGDRVEACTEGCDKLGTVNCW